MRKTAKPAKKNNRNGLLLLFFVVTTLTLPAMNFCVWNVRGNETQTQVNENEKENSPLEKSPQFGPCPAYSFVSNHDGLWASFTPEGKMCYLFYPESTFEHINYHVRTGDNAYTPGYRCYPPILTPDQDWMGSFAGIRLAQDNDGAGKQDFYWLHDSAQFLHSQKYYHNESYDESTARIRTIHVNNTLKLNITEDCFAVPKQPVIVRHFTIKNNANRTIDLGFNYYGAFDINKAERAYDEVRYLDNPIEALKRASNGHYHCLGLGGLEWNWPYHPNDVVVVRDTSAHGAPGIFWKSSTNDTQYAIGFGLDVSGTPLLNIGESGKGNSGPDCAYMKCMDGKHDASRLEIQHTETGNAFIEWQFQSLEPSVSVEMTVFVVCSKTGLSDAFQVLKSARAAEYKTLRDNTDTYWHSWLSKRTTTPNTHKALYDQALLTIGMCQDPRSGAILNGIPCLQPEYNRAWPRDSTFAAVALDYAGYYSEAEAWYDFLAANQYWTKQKYGYAWKYAGEEGCWLMCYDSDGRYSGTVDFQLANRWTKQATDALEDFDVPSVGEVKIGVCIETPEQDQQGIVLWGMGQHYHILKRRFGDEVANRWRDSMRDTVTAAAEYILRHIDRDNLNLDVNGLMIFNPDSEENPERWKFRQGLLCNAACCAGLMAAYDLTMNERYATGALELRDAIKREFFDGYGSNPVTSIWLWGRERATNTDDKYLDVLSVFWPYNIFTPDELPDISDDRSYYGQVKSVKAGEVWLPSLLCLANYAKLQGDKVTWENIIDKIVVPSSTTTNLICERIKRYNENDWTVAYTDGRRATNLGWSSGWFIMSLLLGEDMVNQQPLELGMECDYASLDSYISFLKTSLNFYEGVKITINGVVYDCYKVTQEGSANICGLVLGALFNEELNRVMYIDKKTQGLVRVDYYGKADWDFGEWGNFMAEENTTLLFQPPATFVDDYSGMGLFPWVKVQSPIYVGKSWLESTQVYVDVTGAIGYNTTESFNGTGTFWMNRTFRIESTNIVPAGGDLYRVYVINTSLIHEDDDFDYSYHHGPIYEKIYYAPDLGVPVRIEKYGRYEYGPLISESLKLVSIRRPSLINDGLTPTEQVAVYGGVSCGIVAVVIYIVLRPPPAPSPSIASSRTIVLPRRKRDKTW
ncbi:MAG: hypothetical protein AB1665_02750 [Candidatus Thermoplasmatota archaeon]